MNQKTIDELFAHLHRLQIETDIKRDAMDIAISAMHAKAGAYASALESQQHLLAKIANQLREQSEVKAA